MLPLLQSPFYCLPPSTEWAWLRARSGGGCRWSRRTQPLGDRWLPLRTHVPGSRQLEGLRRSPAWPRRKPAIPTALSRAARAVTRCPLQKCSPLGTSQSPGVVSYVLEPRKRVPGTLANFFSGGYWPPKLRALSAGCDTVFELLGFGKVFKQSWEGVALLPRSPEKGKGTAKGSSD